MAVKRVGILTAGGDSPGLNAAIRGFGKVAIGEHRLKVIGFRDGFRGLAENRHVEIDSSMLAGILTVGGTILGTSREKPHRMIVDGRTVDMTESIMATMRTARLDALVCIGGGGTAKNANRLAEAGLPVVQIPKTIDNDVAMTDASIGFATALAIATEAIDRLHSTAHSHHRIIVAEVMGHRSGWLALGAGLATGADVILIPEIPYDLDSVAAAIRKRTRQGTNFSIVAVAEGARDRSTVAAFTDARRRRDQATSVEDRRQAEADLAALTSGQSDHAFRLAHELEARTGLESRVTILGYVQRGGTPAAADRILAARLGKAAADLVVAKEFGVMAASAGESWMPVALDEVAGKRKTVPLDHPWVATAREVGTSFGD